MSTTRAAGFALVAVLWMVVIVPVIHNIIRFVRTTRWSDLVPTIIRVSPKQQAVRIVSGQRARLDPVRWVQVSPWCYRQRP